MFNVALISAFFQRCAYVTYACTAFFLTLKACTNADFCAAYYVVAMNEPADATCTSASGFAIVFACQQYRLFRQSNQTDWISRLRDTTVTNLMAIQLHSHDIVGFDFMPAIHRWKEKYKGRRLFAATLMLRTQSQIMIVK